jgi:ArsR family transcriptional regulator
MICSLDAVMDPESINQLAAMMSALSQATRLRVMEMLSAAGGEGMAAGDIARSLECPPSTLSFHLKELSQVGLLGAAQQGRFIRYHVRLEALRMFSDELGKLVEAGKEHVPGTRQRKRPGQARKKGGGGEDKGQLSIFGG